jgi:serine/threonine-protein kinase
MRRRFEIEARAAAGLSHPNVVAVFDTGEDEGTPFIVMERLPGNTLADRISAGPVEPAWLRLVAGDVLGALGAAHDAGLIHRDVKPGNILIASDGCAKVTDFGIAKTAEAAGDGTGVDLTATNMLLGTPAYLAPERLTGAPATPNSDLYSLGVLLYEALSGAKPFTGATPVAVAHAVSQGAHQPLVERAPSADGAFVAAIERAMSHDPASRFVSADEMRDALAVSSDPAPTTVVASPRVVGDASGRSRHADAAVAADATSVLAATPFPIGWSPTRRAAAVATALCVGVLLLLAAMGAFAGTGHQPGTPASATDTTAAPTTVATTPPTTAAVQIKVAPPVKLDKKRGGGGGGRGGDDGD